MNRTEYIESGKRFCRCNVPLVCEKKSHRRIKQQFRDEYKQLIANVLNPKYCKPENIYSARCSGCGKLYITSKSKKKFNEYMKRINNGNIHILTIT